MAEGEKGATDAAESFPGGTGDAGVVTTRFSVLDPFADRGGGGRGTGRYFTLVCG